MDLHFRSVGEAEGSPFSNVRVMLFIVCLLQGTGYLKSRGTFGEQVKSADRDVKRGKGGKVKSRKQAIAIGLSEAWKKGKKVPKKKS